MTIVKGAKGVLKFELDVYVWSLFTMQGILYTNSKEKLEAEADNFIRLDKTTFHVNTVHVDRAAADAAHQLLQHKFEKMSNNKLKAFMTKKVTIDKQKMKALIAESNGEAYLELSGNANIPKLGGSLYVLFMPETFLFCRDEIVLQETFKKFRTQFPEAKFCMMCLPDIKCVELEYFNFYHGAPTSDEYKVKSSIKPNTSDAQAMFWACNDPATSDKIRALLTLQTESKFKPRIESRIATSHVASKAQAVVVLPDVCKIEKPQYAPVIAINSSSK